MGNLVKIRILDQELSLRINTDEAKIMAAAELVREKTDEYREATGSNVKHNVVILAALDIANELLQLKNSYNSLQARVEARSREMIKAIEVEVD